MDTPRPPQASSPTPISLLLPSAATSIHSGTLPPLPENASPNERALYLLLGPAIANRPPWARYDSIYRELLFPALKDADKRAAVDLLVTAASDDPTGAVHNNLSKCYRFGIGFSSSDAKELEHAQLSADRGHPDGLCSLGLCYEMGRGIAKDEKKAAELYAKAAEAGLARAQMNYALCLEFGKGVATNSVRAMQWYEKAAAQDYPEALYNLALLLEQAPQKDNARIAALYAAAARQHLTSALYNLALCLQDGRGLPKDEIGAVECLRRAAERGLAVAQCNLGNCFRTSSNVRTELFR